MNSSSSGRMGAVGHRLITAIAIGVLVPLQGCAGGVSEPVPLPSPPTGSAPASSSPSPSGSATPSVSRSTPSSKASPALPSDEASGSSATFEYFKVTVDRIDYRGTSRALVLAKVCVRSLPPNLQGNRTRLSLDPWSVTAGTRASEAGYDGDAPRRMFPSDQTYRVGQCASGWIPFEIKGELDTVRYANGVGDKAVWDADHRDQKPVIRRKSQSDPRPNQKSIGQGTFIVGDDIQPGRYKAKADSDGLCYWARLKDDSGEYDSIIANNATEGSASATISPSDGAFETSGCTPWIKE